MSNQDAGSLPDATILRTEIIESEKAQADFLKWKLISVATVGAVAFGITASDKSPAQSARLLGCLIPVLCAYVDLVSMHFMIRIITIGIYLRCCGDKYERYCFKLREPGEPGKPREPRRGSANPFVFETGALVGSSVLFNVVVVALGGARFGWKWITGCEATFLGPRSFSWAYLCMGVFGILWTAGLRWQYKRRVNGIEGLAKDFFKSTGSPPAGPAVKRS